MPQVALDQNDARHRVPQQIVTARDQSDSVLLVVNDKTVKVGKPGVTGAKVVAELVGEEKGDKVHVMKYKAKSRYRRHTGHRPVFTRVKITSIA